MSNMDDITNTEMQNVLKHNMKIIIIIGTIIASILVSFLVFIWITEEPRCTKANEIVQKRFSLYYCNPSSAFGYILYPQKMKGVHRGTFKIIDSNNAVDKNNYFDLIKRIFTFLVAAVSLLIPALCHRQLSAYFD